MFTCVFVFCFVLLILFSVFINDIKSFETASMMRWMTNHLFSHLLTERVTTLAGFSRGMKDGIGLNAQFMEYASILMMTACMCVIS
jgi:hypothetical protein